MEITVGFLLLTLSLEITPGPAVMFILFQSTLGLRYAVAGVLGLALGNVIWISMVAFGIAVLLVENTLLFSAMRFAGAIYLAFLGWKITQSRFAIDLLEPEHGGRPKLWASVFRGSLCSLSNPKALIFFMALLPQFVSQDRFYQDILYFGGLKISSLITVMLGYAFVGRSFFGYLRKKGLEPAVAKAMGGFVIFAGLALFGSTLSDLGFIEV